MTKEDMSAEAYDKLTYAIVELLLTKGLKATTMDSIASDLQISKRTLYEIFTSKNEMVKCAVEAYHKNHTAKLKEIFTASSNVLEGILRGFIYHRDEMKRVNVDFFRDMDTLFPEARHHSSKHKQKFLENYVRVLNKGVRQGYFRKNVNFMLQCRLLWIQMESLKRMEEVFPPDITLMEAYDSICISFLRAVATPRGMAILDSVVESLENERETLNSQAEAHECEPQPSLT